MPRRAVTDLVAFAVLLTILTLVPFALLRVVDGDPTDSPWFVVATSAPVLAALVLWAAGRRRPREDRLGRARWGAWPRWAVAGIALGAGQVVLGVLLGQVVGGPSLDLGQPARTVADAGGALPVIAMLLLGGPVAEEPGWRGYAQPRLRQRLTPVATSVAIGIVWAAWHVPLFFIDGTTQSGRPLGSAVGLLTLLTFVPLASVFWFVSERLAGGVPGAVLTHVGFNGGSALLGNGSTAAVAGQVVVLVVLAVLVHTAGSRRGLRVGGA